MSEKKYEVKFKVDIENVYPKYTVFAKNESEAITRAAEWMLTDLLVFYHADPDDVWYEVESVKEVEEQS